MCSRLKLLGVLSLLLFVLCRADVGWASDIVGWRGDGTGRFVVSDPPTTWSAE